LFPAVLPVALVVALNILSATLTISKIYMTYVRSTSDLHFSADDGSTTDESAASDRFLLQKSEALYYNAKMRSVVVPERWVTFGFSAL